MQNIMQWLGDFISGILGKKCNIWADTWLTPGSLCLIHLVRK